MAVFLEAKSSSMAKVWTFATPKGDRMNQFCVAYDIWVYILACSEGFFFWRNCMILLMEEILHHLGCIKPLNNGMNYRSTGQDFVHQQYHFVEYLEIS